MMKIQCSDFIRDKIEEMQEFIDRLSGKFERVSILGTDVSGLTFRVSRTGTQLSDYGFKERGFVVRVLKNGHYFEYSFNEWDEIDHLVETFMDAFRANNDLVKEAELNYFDELWGDDQMEYESMETEVKTTLDDLSSAEIMERLTHLRDCVLAIDERILDVVFVINNVHTSKAYTSSLKALSQSYMLTDAMVQVTVKEGNQVQAEMQATSGMKGMEVIDELEKLAQKALNGALELLGAKRMKPGVYDVITAPEVSGLIAHEAFGHGVEMDMFVKNRAKAKDYMGKRVASDLVTMIDGANGVEQVASYLFDDEGTLGHQTVLIKNGILQNGISDRASAYRLGKEPTGNGRRESYERKAYARMTNTYFEKGTSKLDEMIASIQYGFLLEGMFSGMEDPKHWGIQCIIAKAREIVDGKLTGEIYSPVILTGYVPTLLQSISMVSDEIQLSGTGYCGKGHKEWVRVSDGGPYLKAKARLG